MKLNPLTSHKTRPELMAESLAWSRLAQSLLISNEFLFRE